MTETSGGASAAGDTASIGVLDALLLDAKLAVPRVRPGSVSRADLIAHACGSACRVVAVTAPAGYGKSTLLAQWAAAETRPVAWVSFDRFDDDPAALLSVIASAFGAIAPDLAHLIADVRGLGIDSLGRAAPRWPRLFGPVRCRSC